MRVLALAAVVIINGCRRHKRPEMIVSVATETAYRGIQIGATASHVVDVIGPPSGRVGKGLIARTFENSPCLDKADAALLFYRSPQPSFVVYLDATSRVACKERREHLLIHLD